MGAKDMENKDTLVVASSGSGVNEIEELLKLPAEEFTERLLQKDLKMDKQLWKDDVKKILKHGLSKNYELIWSMVDKAQEIEEELSVKYQRYERTRNARPWDIRFGMRVDEMRTRLERAKALFNLIAFV